MFIFLKLVKPLFLPPFLILLGLGFSLWFLFKKKRRAGRIILTATLVIYYLLSTGPLNYLLIRSLETTTPKFTEELKIKPEAIVILAGGARRIGPLCPREELSGASWRRLWRGLEIYRELEGKIPIIYSGGSGNIFDKVSIEGSLSRQYAALTGIPESDFIIETASRNTYENIRETQKLLDKMFPDSDLHRVILVTSSIHMPRAMLISQKSGLSPIPMPADFPIRSTDFNLLDFIPSAEAFAISTSCLHEWLGIIAYRLLGRL